MKNNFPLTQRDDFALRMIHQIERSRVGDIRLYAAGDFADVQILEKWTEVITETPQVKYLCFTHAWQVAEFLPGLTRLAALRNMNLWLSVDADTGEPKGQFRIPNVVFQSK